MTRSLRCPNSGLIRRFVLFLLFAIGIFYHAVGPCGAAAEDAENKENIYESRLDKGLSNTEAYSYLLIKKAHADKAAAKDLLEQAKKYSPDLPAVYFELARESFSPSVHGIFQGLDYFRQGIEAYEKHFWWEFNIAGLVYTSLLISFVLSMLLVLIIRFPMEAGLILHDGAEDKQRLLFLLVPLGLSFFGPIALIAGSFFILGLYFRKRNKIVVYAAVLFFLLSPFFLRTVGSFLSVSPALKAIVAVNEGQDNRYALGILKGKNDHVSLFSYALALKREGDYQEAANIYKNLISSSYASDPRIYVNLGNSYYGLQEIEEAKNSYEKSIAIYPLPTAYYNLSQIYRQGFDFPRGNEYFFEAAKLDPIAVSRFSAVSNTNPNRFVVDERLPISVIWKYVLGGSMRNSGFWNSFTLLQFVAGAVMIPFFYLLHKKIKYRALRCKRCGSIFCSRCSRAISWGEMCPHCFQSLVKIDEVDSKERIARLLAIYQNRTRIRRKAKLLTCLIPGGGQIYSGRIVSGLIFLWSFLFFSTLLVLNSLPSAGLFPFAHEWIKPIMPPLIALTYAASVLHIIRRINRGWL